MATTRELTPADAPALTALYGEYEWWADREEVGVREALERTDVAIGVEADGDLVAAARILTDFTYYGTVYDVIVGAERRGEGLGAMLLEAVLEHPDLADLPGLSLLAREGLVPFYESIGFELFDRAVEHPEGEPEELVRMTYGYDADGEPDPNADQVAESGGDTVVASERSPE